VDELITSWDETIPESLRRLDVPGLAIGICDADRVVWSAGYGTTRRSGGAAISPSTRFSVQSTSKLVTATILMLAVQQGLVDLDEPIGRYLPDFTVRSVFQARPQDLLTLRHLLSHTGGFTHEAPVGSNYDLGTRSFADHCRSIARTWLRFPVGHHMEYSNLGIDLAAFALERVSGTPFAGFADRELFGPLGLTRSTFDPGVVARDPGRAVGHWRPYDRAGRELPVEVPMVAAGGLYTSVEDALRFVQLHLRHGDPLLRAELIAEQYAVPFADPEQRLGYGLGVYVDEQPPGARVLHHGGSGFGFQGQLCWVPDASVGIVVLTNSFDHDLPNELARAFATHVARPTPVAVPADPAATDLGELAGEYVGRFDVLTLRLDGTGLVAVKGDATDPVRAIGPRTVEVQDDRRTRLRATAGRDGSIGYLHDLRDGRTYYRNDVPGPPESTMDTAHLGTYTASAWGLPVARFRLAQDGASPVIQPDSGPALRLTPIDADHYLSSTGEVLDVGGASPSYANIALARTDDPAAQSPPADS
jgi:CubicO group peptidase (beta-lactamase class C family)